MRNALSLISHHSTSFLLERPSPHSGDHCETCEHWSQGSTRTISNVDQHTHPARVFVLSFSYLESRTQRL